jgi:hypothetical protein
MMNESTPFARRIVMTQPRAAGGPIPSRHDITNRQDGMAMTLERRDAVRRAAIVRRITDEFLEMPGLVLTIPQASRLLGVDEPACSRILAGLEREGLLRRRSSGSYGLA